MCTYCDGLWPNGWKCTFLAILASQMRLLMCCTSRTTDLVLSGQMSSINFAAHSGNDCPDHLFSQALISVCCYIKISL